MRRPLPSAVRPLLRRVRVDRLAFAAIAALGACFGLGDIAQVTSLDEAVLDAVRGLLPLGDRPGTPGVLLSGRRPAFPTRWPARPGLALVLVASAALAQPNRLEALASLERPASGALLAWAVYDLSRSQRRWYVLIRAVALGGLAIAVVGLAEASGLPGVRDWLAAMHDGSIPIGDVPRIASTLSHPNEAAMLLELSLPLLVAWAWTARPSWRLPLTLGVLANVVAMVLTFSRAGIVAGLAGLAVLAGVCLARGERRRLLPLGLAVLAVPAALLCAAMTSPGLDHRLTAELSEPASVERQSRADPTGVLGGGLGHGARPSAARGRPGQLPLALRQLYRRAGGQPGHPRPRPVPRSAGRHRRRSACSRWPGCWSA